MFTGLIECVGRLTGKELRAGIHRLRIVPQEPIHSAQLGLGDSVAVDGACLTVVAVASGWFEVDASPETVARTTLKVLNTGAQVHLERALAVGSRLGGHFVTGHVDDVGHLVTAKKAADESLELEVAFPAHLAPFVVDKGSITIDGVSLTVNRVTPGNTLTVMLIPETLRRTNLGHKSPGAAVNLETDILGKYVIRALTTGVIQPVSGLECGGSAQTVGGGGGESRQLTEDMLRKFGFA